MRGKSVLYVSIRILTSKHHNIIFYFTYYFIFRHTKRSKGVNYAAGVIRTKNGMDGQTLCKGTGGVKRHNRRTDVLDDFRVATHLKTTIRVTDLGCEYVRKGMS